MSRGYISRHANAKSAALVRFLTEKSWRKKITAVFNAAAADAALKRSKAIKKEYQAARRDPEKQDDATFLHLLFTRSKEMTSMRAALSIFDKAKGQSAWQKFLETGDEKRVAKALKKVNKTQIAREHKNAMALGWQDAYDARLGRLTPGLRGQDVSRWAAQIIQHKKALQDKAKARARYSTPDIQNINITGDARMRVMRRVLSDLGINETNTSFHKAEHPMCFDVNGRVHLILRADDTGSFWGNLLDTLHEAGHALYRIHMPDEVRESMKGLIETHYTAPDEATAMIFDQNLALSKPFAAYMHKVLQDEVPALLPEGFSKQDVYEALNYQPETLRRIETQPEQYSLFMAQYAHIERALFEGTVKESGLSALWQKLCKDYQGAGDTALTPHQSVYQDPHWMLGELGRFSAGYFPGMLMAAQIYAYMEQTAPEVIQNIEKGDFNDFTAWMTSNLYTKNRCNHYNDFMRKVMKKDLFAHDFLRKIKI